MVSASSCADVNLRRLYALGTILPQLFSASLLGREYLSIPTKDSLASAEEAGNHPFPEELCCLSLAVSPCMSPRKAGLHHETRASIPESIIRVSQAQCHVTGRHEPPPSSVFLFHIALTIAFTTLLPLGISLT